MSVSFTWKPVNPDKGTSFAAGSNLNMALVNAFGEFPFTLSDSDFGVINGMIACGHEDLSALITAIAEHGPVEVQSNW